MNNSGTDFQQSQHDLAKAADTTAEAIQNLVEYVSSGKTPIDSGPERRRARRTAERAAARQNQRAIQTGTFKRVEQDYLRRVVNQAPPMKLDEPRARTVSDEPWHLSFPAVGRNGEGDWVNPRGGLFA